MNLLRWCVPRFAAPLAVLAGACLASCAPPPMVAAPLVPPQPPYGEPQAPPPTAAPQPAGPAKAALLVPLSGANAALGKAMLNAAQLALFETGGDQLTLVPRDTGGTPGGAAGAARGAIAEGARIIFGPLVASEVEAVKPVAAAAHVNVVAFSTVESLAGGNTFLMGFLPREEVVREVGFARDRGMRRFAVLAPNTPYGHLMANALRQTASPAGASVTGLQFYQPGGEVETAIRGLLPAGAQPSAAPDQGPSAAIPPAPSFDALLLPEGGAQLHQIAQRLRTAGLDTRAVRLLGSGLWDEPNIGSDQALDGGWFAAAPPEARRDFEQRYRATYGSEPPRLAALGYDAAALAAALARGEGGPPFSREAILNPNGFTGVDGLFRFTPAGLVQRALAVLEVQPEGNIVVSPAPQNFQNIGY